MTWIDFAMIWIWTVSAAAVGAEPLGTTTAEHLHPAELGEQLTHSTWADDFVLVAKTLRDLQRMAREFHEIVRNHRFRIAEHKMHLWSLERPARISVAGPCGGQGSGEFQHYYSMS